MFENLDLDIFNSIPGTGRPDIALFALIVLLITCLYMGYKTKNEPSK